MLSLLQLVYLGTNNRQIVSCVVFKLLDLSYQDDAVGVWQAPENMWECESKGKMALDPVRGFDLLAKGSIFSMRGVRRLPSDSFNTSFASIRGI